MENVNDLISEYFADIEKLYSRLKRIKILDPACGGGAFLTKAFDVLLEIAKRIRFIKEIDEENRINWEEIQSPHERRIEEEEAKLILKNNVYGVDINERSVEFTKARLYLRMARKDRLPLDLSQNIKSGDSLIDDISLRGDKAFHWSHQFEGIMNKGGFDIIIGNPPYVNIIEDLSSKKYYKHKYPEIYTGKNDLYYYFFQKAIELCKKNGYIAFIAPRYLMEAFKARKLREYILKETIIQKIIDFSDFKVFRDANIDTAIYFLIKGYIKNEVIIHQLVKPIAPPLRLEPPLFLNYSIKQNLLGGKKWYFIDPKIQNVLDKIDEKSNGNLKDFSIISKGIQTGKDSVFVITKDEVEKYSIEKSTLRLWLKNSQISRFAPLVPQLFVIMSNRKTIKELSNFPNLETYFLKYKNELLNRARVGKWFHWRKGDERFTIDWNKPKIVTPYKSANNNFTIDDKGCYFSQDIVLILPTNEIDIRYLLAYLNSKACEFYFKIKGKRLGAVYEYYPRQIEGLPFIKISKEEQESFIKIVDRLFKLNSLLFENHSVIISEYTSIEEEIQQAKKELDNLFYTLFDLKNEEIKLIE